MARLRQVRRRVCAAKVGIRQVITPFHHTTHDDMCVVYIAYVIFIVVIIITIIIYIYIVFHCCVVSFELSTFCPPAVPELTRYQELLTNIPSVFLPCLEDREELGSIPKAFARYQSSQPCLSRPNPRYCFTGLYHAPLRRPSPPSSGSCRVTLRRLTVPFWGWICPSRMTP